MFVQQFSIGTVKVQAREIKNLNCYNSKLQKYHVLITKAQHIYFYCFENYNLN